MVMGFDMVYLAILVLQRGLYVIEIKRDDDFIKQLREAETAFWTQYVEQGRMPQPDGESDLETLRELYPQSYKDSEIMIPGLDRMITDYLAIKEMADSYTKRADSSKSQICALLGKHEVGIGDKYGCSWKTQSKKSGYDMERLQADYPYINIDKYKKVSTYRVFRTKTMKK
jgi:predicted phage-related endonuclease